MFRRLGANHTAILLFSSGIFFFAANDALGKWLVAVYPVGQVILLRTLGAACILGPLLYRSRSHIVVPRQWPLHLLRVFVMAFDSFAFFYATQTLPLADVMTFYLASPLFITVLSVLVLGEFVGPARWVALVVGFVGVVVALRPSGAALSPGALIALSGSMMFALSIIITRQLREAHWLTLISWQFLGAGVIGAITSSVVWVAPSATDAGLMAFMGLISMLCFVAINQALRLANASLLAPFHYMAIVWALIFGWAIWRDIPSGAVFIGIALIVASGLFVWHHESSAKRIAAGPKTVG